MQTNVMNFLASCAWRRTRGWMRFHSFPTMTEPLKWRVTTPSFKEIMARELTPPRQTSRLQSRLGKPRALVLHKPVVVYDDNQNIIFEAGY